MIGIAAVIAQQLRRLAVVVHQEVEIAVVVEITDSYAATHARQAKISAKLITNIFKDTAPAVAEHELRLGIARVGVVSLDVVEHMPVGDEDVARAVVVIIENAG